MTYGLVSVIMPNYNGARFIAETIGSVIAQTYTDWELLIVDDCSDDDSVKIVNGLAEKDPRVKLFVNEKNCGAAEARNVALRAASGKWIAFLDADDVWLPEKLQKQLDFLHENGGNFCYTSYTQIDENSSPLGIRVTGPGNLTKRKMYRCCYPGCLTVMYDAEITGLLQIPPEIGNGENDYALWLKAVRCAPCLYLGEDLSLYRVRASSLSHGNGKWKLIKNHYKMYRLSEKKTVFVAIWRTAVNVFFTFFKKMRYFRKIKRQG